MSKERIGQAGALLISAGLAYAGMNDMIPCQPVTERKNDLLYEKEYKQCTKRFLQLCEQNNVVTTNQQLEKFRTFGGRAQPDPYVKAFDQMVKQEQVKE